MPTILPRGADLQGRLDALVERHGVPGAVVGVLVGDDQVVRAAGSARLPNGPPVTTETLFLIASITKVWTATLVMQLVDEGRVDLDAPVNRYLDPPLRLADMEATVAVTVRQLLTHSGGFAGDADEPPWPGDDAVALMVASYSALGQLHRPGRLFSYSNTGFNVLGRLVECLRDTTWDAALKECLLTPLGLEHTFSVLEEAAVHPLAVGHQPNGTSDGTLEPVTVWRNPRGSGPCGGTLATTAGDLLRFARMHIRDGVGTNGRRVLSFESARLMREQQMPRPGPTGTAWWGLGWSIDRTENPLVVEHDGDTCGQQSSLLVVPDRDLALCVLTNGDPYGHLLEDLTRHLLHELAGISPPSEPEPDRGEAPDPEPILGTYGSGDVAIEVHRAENGLAITFQTSGAVTRRLRPFSAPLSHVRASTYMFAVPQQRTTAIATFVSDRDDARPTHVSIGVRVLPRVAR